MAVQVEARPRPAPHEPELSREPIVAARYMLDGVVTTVDAVNGAGTLDRQPEAVKQAAVADRLLLTKTDLAEPPGRQAFEARLAALERSLMVYWWRQLGLSSQRPADALTELRRHAEAGPLLGKLESWLHSPIRQDKIDVNELLEPYRRLPANALQAEVR